MTCIVTWNIQNGRGCDGRIDLARIARVVHAMGDPDVVCLQEIARHDPQFDGGADQAAQLAGFFPGFSLVFGSALHRAGNRQYGNLVLARLPVLQVFNHLLPHPAGKKHMQRQATEVVVQAAGGPLRVMTTHLEYYSVTHRQAQIARLRELQAEVSANEASPAKPDSSPYDRAPRPSSLVLCGDFNVAPHDAEYQTLFAAPLADAWSVLFPDKPHPHTTGLHDRAQWPDGGHCRDYFAVTADVAQRVRAFDMDAATDASDHQPLRLVLA